VKCFESHVSAVLVEDHLGVNEVPPCWQTVSCSDTLAMSIWSATILNTTGQSKVHRSGKPIYNSEREVNESNITQSGQIRSEEWPGMQCEDITIKTTDIIEAIYKKCVITVNCRLSQVVAGQSMLKISKGSSVSLKYKGGSLLLYVHGDT